MIRGLALLLLLLALPAPALASGGLAAQPRRLELVQEQNAFTGQFRLENRGGEPIEVASLGARQKQALVPRLPPGMSAKFEDGAEQATLGPGESKLVKLSWPIRKEGMPDEIYAALLIETEGQGPPLAVGIHVDRKRSLLTDHGLSALLLLPLLGALLAAVWRKPRWVALGVALGQLAIAIGFHAELDVGLTQYQGSGGFQFIEAAPLLPALGTQYLLGIDGLAAGLLPLIPLLLALGALSEVEARRFWPALLLLDAGLVGVLVALDVALVLTSLVTAALAVIWLAGAFGEGGRRTAGTLALAIALIGIGLLQLSEAAGPGLLIDGTIGPRTLAVTELLHADLLARGGPAAVKLAFVPLLVGFALLLGAAPLHGWLVSAAGSLPAPAAILIAGGLPPIGAFGILRFGHGLLPEATAWAATTIAAWGLGAALWAALAATAERDRFRFAGYASSIGAGFILLGASGLTAIGVQGALLLAIGQSLATCMLLAAPAARWPGGLALAATVGLPGTAGFAGLVMVLLGAFPRHPGLALAFALVLVVSAVAHAGCLSGAFRDGERPRIPAAFGIAAALALLLGLWPRAITRVTEASAFDHADRVARPGPIQVARAPVEGADESVAMATAPR
jgi:NADH:ubiquinone oxidoreductase subunit 4 (subunit M)